MSNFPEIDAAPRNPGTFWSASRTVSTVPALHLIETSPMISGLARFGPFGTIATTEVLASAL